MRSTAIGSIRGIYLATGVAMLVLLWLLIPASAVAPRQSVRMRELAHGVSCPVPVRAPDVDLGGHRAVSLAMGGYDRVCAVLDDGGVTCWGNTEAEHLEAAGDTTCDVAPDGLVRCTGDKMHGQLGRGVMGRVLAP